MVALRRRCYAVRGHALGDDRRGGAPHGLGVVPRSSFVALAAHAHRRGLRGRIDALDLAPAAIVRIADDGTAARIAPLRGDT